MNTTEEINRMTGLQTEAGRYIAGGVVSLNRKVTPHIVFRRGEGSKIYDENEKEYIDYHAAFAPHLLGHNNPVVNEAVVKTIQDNWSLFGSGTNQLEIELAKLVCNNIPSVELVQVTNTGSEATAHAIRLARAYTGREDIILMLGGYNGWHNEVARTVMPSLEHVGQRISVGAYPFIPLSAGIPEQTKKRVHIVNFNDPDSVEYIMKNYPVACILTEPVLQNIGVVLPRTGYLQSLIDLCDKYGALCIFDEVKTGFRTALGGYQSVEGLKPHISVFGKAIANGYPLGVIGGKKEIMERFDHPDAAKRVLISGTYNAHPVNVAAAIATIKILQDTSVYKNIWDKSKQLYDGLQTLFTEKGMDVVISYNQSAFGVYFCNERPADLHDILYHHNFDLDKKYRLELIRRGIYHIPLPCKQGSVSYAHSHDDIHKTLDITREVLKII